MSKYNYFSLTILMHAKIIFSEFKKVVNKLSFNLISFMKMKKIINFFAIVTIVKLH